MDRYEAEAIYQDGTGIKINGTLQQMANWADNLILASDQGLTINIRRVEGKHGKD